jgi:hypothetical protein
VPSEFASTAKAHFRKGTIGLQPAPLLTFGVADEPDAFEVVQGLRIDMGKP